MTDKFQAVVIGGGPGGYVCAIRLSQLGLKTACIESRGSLGGTCLNIGCIPSKSLLNLSEEFHKAKNLSNKGIEVGEIKLNLSKMMKNKDKAVTVLTKGVEFLLKKNKVTYFKGTGSFKSKNKILITENEIKKETLIEKAENLMIVDLMRNDLSTVCRPGSVTVDSLFKIKRYSTLTQLESTVSGKLRDNISLYNIFKNTMPPGSVTGTPKKKAAEIISQVEKHQRGPYCGAVGYIDSKDNFCFSVGIRLSIINNERKSFYTGAGIVWDSKPKKENSETYLKAKAFRNTLSNL